MNYGKPLTKAQRIEPQAACKRGLNSQKLKALRLKLVGKTDEEIALIMGVDSRAIRRQLDYLKGKLNVYCSVALAHAVHSFDCVFTCEGEKADFQKGAKR